MHTHASYRISTHFWTIRDAPAPDDYLDFHLKTGDYLATLSTIMGALGDELRDNIARGESPDPRHIDMLEKLRADLYFLHANYRLEPKQTPYF